MADISQYATQIRQAIYGKDVRESMATGIEVINVEVESTTARQETVENLTQQAINLGGNPSLEVTQARGSYANLSERLNENDLVLEAKANQADLDITNANVALKAERVYVDSQIQNMSAQVQGFYPTLAALTAAFPSGNNNNYVVQGDIAEVASLTISSVPTTPGSITITLNGVAATVAVDPTTHSTTDLVATAIRNTSFSGWTTGGTGSTVTFTCNTTGSKMDSTFADTGSTGVTGTMTTITQGVDVDNYIYRWNGSWASTGYLFNANGIADRTITPLKLSQNHLIANAQGKNLFDLSKVTEGKYVSATTGAILTAAGRYLSEKIYLLPNTTYTKTKGDVAIYNSNGVFLAGSVYSAKQFTTPADTSYILISVNDDTALNILQIELGSIETEYETGLPKINKKLIVKFEDEVSEIISNTVMEEQNFKHDVVYTTVKNKNLFNKMDTFKDSYIDYNDGVLRPATGYQSSDYIKVLASTQYAKNLGNLAIYDSNRIFINGVLPSTLAFITPANAAYARISTTDSNIESLQLELGSTNTTYESGLPKILPEQVSDLTKGFYKNFVVVAKKGSNYTSITKAIDDCIAEGLGTAENPVTIILMPGVYEEVVHIHDSKQYFSIIGINKRTCIIMDNTGDYYNAPLNMAGNVFIDNVTVITTHNNPSGAELPSYAIHHDFGGEGVSEIRNSKLISYQSAALGIGSQNKQTIIVDRCELISYASASALLFHNQQPDGAIEQKLIVKASRIQSDYNTAVLIVDANHSENGGAGDSMDTTVSFYNNIFWSTLVGKTNIVGLSPAPLATGKLAGYIALTADSWGNNVPELNAQ